LNAAEAVFDYAVTELGFKEEEIVLYAWSIGGFPAAHLAASHPKVKALVCSNLHSQLLIIYSQIGNIFTYAEYTY